MQERILDVAQSLIETRGYNAFSYRDIADEVGIKTASIHYYFPRKPDLVAAILQRYGEHTEKKLAEISEVTPSARARLFGFVSLLEGSLCSEKKMCLCGMLASEIGTLEPQVQEELAAFFGRVRAWIKTVMEDGARAGEFRTHENPDAIASLVFACFEGILLMGRMGAERFKFAEQAQRFIELL